MLCVGIWEYDSNAGLFQRLSLGLARSLHRDHNGRVPIQKRQLLHVSLLINSLINEQVEIQAPCMAAVENRVHSHLT